MPESPSSPPEPNVLMSPLETLRHTCAHVMATAILELWPDTQFAAGPPVDNGFYYDLELHHKITPDDFPRIEAIMARVIKEAQPLTRRIVPREEAAALAQNGRLAALSERPQPSKFKSDILQSIPDNEAISLYQNGAFLDLCAGPHLPSTDHIGAFKLMSVASAYYKGDESQPQLQRLYGTAFPSREALDQYLEMLEEAKKRDHRKLGRDLKIFQIDDAVGQGLVLWLPNGAIIRQALQDFISEKLRLQGYQTVFTPHIGKLGLYRTSGHFPYYKESQFTPIIDGESLRHLAEEGCTCAQLGPLIDSGEVDGFLLKPMNCPHHIRIYVFEPRSYRDLPIRLAEFGTVYRWEKSGEIGGMTRVRGFTQDDAHIFCTEDQVGPELLKCLGLVQTVFETLGMHDYRVRVGLRDPDSSKYTGDPADWDRAESILRHAAQSFGAPFTEEPGEAAFYGPKIDFVVRDVIGREWQLGTVQVDYNLPVRFDLAYTGADNEKHRPIMIHRAPFGSMERFIGVLIEHFAGAFPLWLAPEQVRILPISEKAADYAHQVHQTLLDHQVRAHVDRSNDKVGAKIRQARIDKVPYMLVVGPREAAENLVAIRSRTHGEEGTQPLTQFLERLSLEIRDRIR